MERPKNPLGFIDDLLEEEKASSQYFGDVVFWKHFEWIDVPHIYQPSSLEYRNLKLMVRRFLNPLANKLYDKLM